nr:MAG TPA: hypothetical protein [Caudoviricetes sp.]
MSKLCNLYKNAISGMVKFLEIEYNSPAKPQNQYVDHTLKVHLRRDSIYQLDRYHELMISVSTNSILAFSDCSYFAYIDDGHTLSLLFNNNTTACNLSIEVEGNDLGSVKFTELSNPTGYTVISPFMNASPSKNIFGYISKTPTVKYLTANNHIFLACLSYSSYIVGEQNGGKQCLLNGDDNYQLTNLVLEKVNTIQYSGVDVIYVYKVTASANDQVLLW